ncbi:hypothetical protein GCM10010470_34900 [Saccharopolyspora taberi]|uniref:Peptidase S8/S53 domain-containing protein n=2 Tax=Saccharopolyspora taberi TaxID=60895 RepID=A0ABN3VEC4_9PSEU
MGGTSMATPHVAGALALELNGRPREPVADARILRSSAPGKISDVRGVSNQLLNVSGLGG